MPPKDDPQLSASRELILDAFPDLVLDLGYAKMTVQDVLQRANVGRTTFYAHFNSKEDLLKQSVARLRDGLASAARADLNEQQEQRLAFTLHFFRHIISHRLIYDAIIARPEMEVVKRYFLRMLAELVRNELSAHPHPAVEHADSLEFAVQHTTGAIWAVGCWWLESSKMSAESLNAHFRKMTLPGLDALLAPQ